MLAIVPLAGASPVGTDGGMVSIRNGPRRCLLVQLPTLSTVEMWKYQSPLLVAVNVPPDQVSSASLVSVGVQETFWSQSYSKPSTPLPPGSLTPETAISTVASLSHSLSVWLVLDSVGSVGRLASIGSFVWERGTDQVPVNSPSASVTLAGMSSPAAKSVQPSVIVKVAVYMMLSCLVRELRA